jgi:hypothetical protein
VRARICERIAIRISTTKKKMASERVNKQKRVVPTIATKLQIVEREVVFGSSIIHDFLLTGQRQPVIGPDNRGSTVLFRVA